MSTAGKVLTILVVLALVGWLFLLSSAAQLNTNWGKAVSKASEQITQVEEQVNTLKAEVQKSKSAIDLAQHASDIEANVLQARISESRSLLAQTIESQTRAMLQLATLKAAVASGNSSRDNRANERTNTEKQLADTKAAVEAIKLKNAELLAELEKLRSRYQMVSGQNRDLARQLSAIGGEVYYPSTAVRSASFPR